MFRFYQNLFTRIGKQTSEPKAAFSQHSFMVLWYSRLAYLSQTLSKAQFPGRASVFKLGEGFRANSLPSNHTRVRSSFPKISQVSLKKGQNSEEDNRKWLH
jgi:hypothetical protein